MYEEQCFLCAIKEDSKPFVKTDSVLLPASQKSVQVVLQHLAKCLNIKLKFLKPMDICGNCYDDLAKYDKLMVGLLSHQRKLTKQLQVALDVCETDEREEFEASVITKDDEQMTTDADHKERSDSIVEFVEIDSNMTKACGEQNKAVSDDKNSSTIATKLEKYCCPSCNNVYDSKHELQRHKKEAHKKNFHVCGICGAACRNEEYLQLHQNLHEGKSEKECRFCSKLFARRVNAVRHMRRHWDKKEYQCEKCGECFSVDNMLYNHQQRHKAEEHPIVCAICNRPFRTRKTYNHHMIIHEKNRPRYKCDICLKSFTEPYTLKMHKKNHENVRKIPLEEQQQDDVDDEQCQPVTIDDLDTDDDVTLK